MENFLAFPLELLPHLIITLIIAFTVHEFAHAYTAYKLGDSTAKNEGRLTLSPISHVDPIGALAIILAGFGWAKPVPVNRFYFKNPRIGGILVSFAGPLSNLILAFGVLILWNILLAMGLIESFPPLILEFLDTFVPLFIYLNVLLFIFNLLPFPPLDGYRIVEDLSPAHIRVKLTEYEKYGVFIFLILVITPLDQYTIHPILNEAIPYIIELMRDVTDPVYTILLNR